MNVKCPHCSSSFELSVNETDTIVSQIKNEAFEKELEERLKQRERELEDKYRLEMELAVKNAVETAVEPFKKEKETLSDKIYDLEKRNAELVMLESSQKEKQELAIMKAVQKVEVEKKAVEDVLNYQKDSYELKLKEKDEQISFYKDLKIKMSTKMIGETLEQHCSLQFEQIRHALPKTVEFNKDNEISETGSKGDFIYREWDEYGNEIISIMFEMKNEMDTTSTKHKNSDFFKELDKDRKEKGCEYAILVSLLESENELYNAGIYDVSHLYDKMYVVRPQCFIPIITILRNAAMNSLEYKQELANIKNQNIDVARFEETFEEFKVSFGKNYKIAHDHFEKAIDEIDKSIARLQKVKEELLGSDRQLRIANDKANGMTVSKIAKNSPSILAVIDKDAETKKPKKSKN